MTSIGHSIVGASFSVISLPGNSSPRYKTLNTLIFIVLANLPDLPLPNWSHQFYDFSHSLLVNIVLIALLALILLNVSQAKKIPGLRHLILPLACAWLSHILLDTLYNHGNGVAIFWPFAASRLAIPVPWFSVLPMDPLHNLGKIFKIFTLEVLSYGPLLLLSVGLHRWKKARLWSTPAPVPVPVSEKSRG